MIKESSKFEFSLKTFYCLYYWFYLFYKKYQLENGKDVGIEQQLFQIITEFEPLADEIDWDFVEDIESYIKVHLL
ncbi:hypothetical protein [Flammeovirga kamogawensis]|uniref:Uncharacterized protein n=1 Tax=Flammeovirga kamogawensis TaxID=373891 RepID=A0ABX8H2H4_9BACT|nr:hypothetical protein [Flammeovirga kamogawensis]MBB6460302.1 hypothetical protein [Flammeovirga kamogawensis]QWG10111.1 hypothetical protein KM029_20735 [Flammeovirga kamogawensis]TRX65619.1 hypothetical protein EO216_24165 [Flammeovirga kamogawensis]